MDARQPHRSGWGGVEGEIDEAVDHQRVHHADAVGLYQEAPADKKAKVPSNTWQFLEIDVIALCGRFKIGGVHYRKLALC